MKGAKASRSLVVGVAALYGSVLSLTRASAPSRLQTRDDFRLVVTLAAPSIRAFVRGGFVAPARDINHALVVVALSALSWCHRHPDIEGLFGSRHLEAASVAG
jgi:hypothetical protein